jgi:hypothetical protein
MPADDEDVLFLPRAAAKALGVPEPRVRGVMRRLGLVGSDGRLRRWLSAAEGRRLGAELDALAARIKAGE